MKIELRKEHIEIFGGSESLSLLHISDIHLWFSTKVLNALSVLIEKTTPDLVVLTGDYYDTTRGAHHFRKFLVDISQRYVIVFIKGNHDNMYGPEFSALLLGIPFCFCVDDSVFRFQSKRGFYHNITSWRNKHALPDHIHESNIILVHNPEEIVTKEVRNINLILAGHLHGGQVIFFKRKDNSFFPGSILYQHCTDREKIGTATLIVSKGLGDTLPIRINCPREVVQITVT